MVDAASLGAEAFWTRSDVHLGHDAVDGHASLLSGLPNSSAMRSWPVSARRVAERLEPLIVFGAILPQRFDALGCTPPRSPRAFIRPPPWAASARATCAWSASSRRGKIGR